MASIAARMSPLRVGIEGGDGAKPSLLEVAVDLEARKDLAQVAYLPVEHGIRRWLRITSDATSCATASEIPSRE